MLEFTCPSSGHHSVGPPGSYQTTSSPLAWTCTNVLTWNFLRMGYLDLNTCHMYAIWSIFLSFNSGLRGYLRTHQSVTNDACHCSISSMVATGTPTDPDYHCLRRVSFKCHGSSTTSAHPDCSAFKVHQSASPGSCISLRHLQAGCSSQDHYQLIQSALTIQFRYADQLGVIASLKRGDLAFSLGFSYQPWLIPQCLNSRRRFILLGF